MGLFLLWLFIGLKMQYIILIGLEIKLNQHYTDKTTTQRAFSKASFVEINDVSCVSLYFSNIVNGQKCQSVKEKI